MELKPGKRKKHSFHNDLTFFPSLNGDSFTGYFNGVSVIVKENIKEFHSMGFYGKGNLSRSVPLFDCLHDVPEVVTAQQYMNRKCYNYEASYHSADIMNTSKTNVAESSVKHFLTNASKKVVSSWSQWKEKRAKSTALATQAHCSWQDIEEVKDDLSGKQQEPNSYWENLVKEILRTGQPRETPSLESEVLIVEDAKCPTIAKAPPAPREILHLNLQEAFFLTLVGKLRVYDMEGLAVEAHELWKMFRLAEDEFVKRYVGYHWYRSRGWVVRPGIKYGGDFLLYEKGPPFYHSTYVVHIVSDESFTWNQLLSFQRLAETSKKDLLLCYILPPKDLLEEEFESPSVISRYRVQESLYRRWIPTQQVASK